MIAQLPIPNHPGCQLIYDTQTAIVTQRQTGCELIVLPETLAPRQPGCFPIGELINGVLVTKQSPCGFNDPLSMPNHPGDQPSPALISEQVPEPQPSLIGLVFVAIVAIVLKAKVRR